MEKTSKPKLSITICCHDAGGANQLYYWCLRWRDKFDLNIVAQGPAVSIFNETFFVSNKLDAIPSADIVITGSGWQSGFESEAILAAKKNCIPSVTFLDHWSNYSNRFYYNGCVVLPDKIWVADSHARKIISITSFFKNIPVRMIGNPFWKAIRSEVGLVDFNKNGLLLALEPIRTDGVDPVFLAKKVARLIRDEFNEYEIIFRVHPSGPDQFSSFLLTSLSDLKVAVSDKTIVEDLSNVSVVLGYQTALLPLAANLGKRTISFLPELLPTVLPHEEIEYYFK